MKRTLASILILFFCAAAAAFAQTETTSTAATTTSTATSTAVVLDTDSASVRQKLYEVLERQPPQVGRVLKMDPTLFHNETYLSNYPALAAYLKEHPEISHTPAYYLEGIYTQNDFRPSTPGERVWGEFLEGFAIFLTISGIAAVLGWLLRTLIEHRRWSRLSKVQSEVHNKILDRFASNEDLMRYLQTPAGKNFLESTPMQVEPPARPISAPITRILWSVQGGLVLFAAGLGMMVVSSTIVQKDVAEPFSAFGVLALSVGVGLIVSSFASYILSRRLGLWGSEEPSRTAAE